MAIGTNGSPATPQDVLAYAVKTVETTHSSSGVTNSELAVALADAAGRMHAANQAEVENLFRVIDSKSVLITVQHRMKAAEKLAALLGLD